MGNNEKISALEAEITRLRDDAMKADAGMALMIGMLLEASAMNFKLDAESILRAANHPGWISTISERMSEGMEMIRKARVEN